MKIGNPDGKGPLTPAVTPRAAGAESSAPATRTEAPAAGTKGDTSTQVQLSDTASVLIGGGVQGGDFDKAKVEQVSQSIAAGTYKVNPEVIADKLIANAKELLGKSTL